MGGRSEQDSRINIFVAEAKGKTHATTNDINCFLETFIGYNWIVANRSDRSSSTGESILLVKIEQSPENERRCNAIESVREDVSGRENQKRAIYAGERIDRTERIGRAGKGRHPRSRSISIPNALLSAPVTTRFDRRVVTAGSFSCSYAAHNFFMISNKIKEPVRPACK